MSAQPKQTAIEIEVANLLPPKLQTAGWRLHETGGKWRAKNKKLGLFSSACDYPGEAVAAAQALADGKHATLSGENGAVTFTDPDPPGSNGEMIRCPECGIADELEPNFIGEGTKEKLESFTCPRGHVFNGRESKEKPKGKTKAPKTPATILAQPLPNFSLIERKDLQPGKTNARQTFDETKLRELGESIREKGILEPLIVRQLKPGKYEIVAGERRYRAAALVNLHWLPCIIKKLTDQEAEEIQTIENDQREDLNPIERGAGYLKLIERHGHTPETLAAAVNKSKTFIYDQIKLAKLPDVARKALLEGKIPQSTATLIARIPSESRREKAAEEIIGSALLHNQPWYQKEALSFREAKSLIERKFSLQLKGTPFSREDATLVPAAGACTTCPKLTGNNRAEFPDGRADVCTDPQCFNQKIAAHDARTRTKAKENEIKVLSASETKKLFSCGFLNHYGAGEAYIDLAEQCSLDKQKKKRSYKQLLGDAVAPVLAINPKSHRAHYLVTKKEAAPILLKTHQIKIYVPSSSTSRSSSPKKDPKAEAKRQLEENVFELAVQLAGEEIALQAEVAGGVIARSPGASEYLKPIALLMFENALNIGDGDAEERIAIRLGLISPPKEKSTTKKKHLSRNVSAWRALQKFVEKGSQSSTPEQIFGAVLQMEFAADSYGNKLDDRQQRILGIFPRVGAFETYLVRAREELTKPLEPPSPTVAQLNAKAKAAGRGR